MGNSELTIMELKRSLTAELSAIFSPREAQSVSRLILEHLGFPELSILSDPTTIIDSKLQAEINKIVDELNSNRPIQYILGETEFYGLRLIVNENVLIPRPETEELVSMIIKDSTLNSPAILDCGTGSGCIAIALSKNLKNAQTIAIDVDPGAIAVARKNATINQVSIEFITESLFDISSLPHNKSIDILVSNPPYVTVSDREKMMSNVIDFEPQTALFVPENDPLIFYKEIIRLADINLAPEGVIWVEINEALGSATKILFQKSGYDSVSLFKDMHGKYRFIKAMKQNGRL